MNRTTCEATRAGTRGVRRYAWSAGLAAVVTAAAVTGAHALWSDPGVVIPAMETGGVAFSAYTADLSTQQYSPDGAPVTVTMPGSVIAEALTAGAGGPPAQPVIWRFTAAGWADGITGMVYDVNVTSQGSGDSIHPLVDGSAAEGTLLHYMTMTVFPGRQSGECGDAPELPTPPVGGPARNVYVFDRADGGFVEGVSHHPLQEAGTRVGDGETTQEWCVAIVPIVSFPDYYGNDVTVAGRDDAKEERTSIAHWNAWVKVDPTAPGPNAYVNRVDAVGSDADDVVHRDQDTWQAPVFADPNLEPDVTIVLDPAVTNQNPKVVQPSDHFAFQQTP